MEIWTILGKFGQVWASQDKLGQGNKLEKWGGGKGRKNKKRKQQMGKGNKNFSGDGEEGGEEGGGESRVQNSQKAFSELINEGQVVQYIAVLYYLCTIIVGPTHLSLFVIKSICPGDQ